MHYIRFFVYAVVLTIVTQSSAAGFKRLCRKKTPKQDIDWERLSKSDGIWYDLIETSKTPIDCYQFEDIRPTENGFNYTFHLYTEEGVTQSFPVEFVRKKNGFYHLAKHVKSAFSNRTLAAIAHKADEKEIETMNILNEAHFNVYFYFQTDYDNYFILGICNPGQAEGMVNYIKFRETSPDPKHVTEVWNFFSQHKAPIEAKWKDICANWSKES